MASDADFFRYKTTYATGQEYFSRSYRAKGPATSAMKQEGRWGRDSGKTYTIQKLAAVLVTSGEGVFDRNGDWVEINPTAELRWVDYETK